MSKTTEKRSLLSRIGRWTAELFLVFIGVYAAFWLNSYQQHRQDAERRDRILASLRAATTQGIRERKNFTAQEEQRATEFRRALETGEMPPLRPFVFTTDYSPGDIATMLQSGGVELLDVKTLIALRGLESVIRWGLERYSALPEIERRVDCAESRSGHFFLLRSSYTENCGNVSRFIHRLWKQRSSLRTIWTEPKPSYSSKSKRNGSDNIDDLHQLKKRLSPDSQGNEDRRFAGNRVRCRVHGFVSFESGRSNGRHGCSRHRCNHSIAPARTWTWAK